MQNRPVDDNLLDAVRGSSVENHQRSEGIGIRLGKRAGRRANRGLQNRNLGHAQQITS
jgi:hypothetical protein